MVQRLEELTVVSPDLLAVVLPGVFGTTFLRAVVGTLVEDDEVDEGIVEGVEVAESPEGDAVHHEGADLSETVVITETEFITAAPIPVPLVLLGPVEDGEGHFVPSDAVAFSGDEATTEEGTVGAEEESAVRGGEGNSGSGSLEHVYFSRMRVFSFCVF